MELVPGDIDAKLALWSSKVMPGRALLYLGRPTEGLPAIEASLATGAMPVATVAQREERDFILNGSYLLLGEGYADSQPARARAFYTGLIDHVGRMQRAGASDWESDFTRASGLAERADVEVHLGDTAAAVRDDQAAIAALRKLDLSEHNHEMATYLAHIQLQLADLLAKLGRFAEARQISDTAIDWVHGDAVADPSDSSRLRLLALLYSARAKVEERSGSRDAACSVGQNAAAIWRLTARRGAGTPMDETASGAIAGNARLIAQDCQRHPTRP